VSVIDLEEGRKESINANKKLNSWRPHGYGSVPCIDLPTIKLALLFSVSQPGRSPALPVSSLSPAPTLPMQRPGGHGLTCCIPAPDKAATSLLALASAKVKV
jgi:hypothetical protein